MRNIEIPTQEEKTARYRLFEMLPGILSWSILLLPLLLSFISTLAAAVFVLLFMLSWAVKASGYAVRVLQGYQRMQKFMRFDWDRYLKDFSDYRKSIAKYKDKEKLSGLEKWHYQNLCAYAAMPDEQKIDPNDLLHVAIIPTYNEGLEVVEPTVKSLLKSTFDPKKILVVIAYEERGGEKKEKESIYLAKKYKPYFYDMLAIKHPANLPNEVIGKGGNATYAGKAVAEYVKEKGIDPNLVLVTTLDSDNRPHPKYFSALSYTYITDPDRRYKSYQPIPMFLNNIWDAPAPMRVLATGNSFWNLIVSSRPHLMRNFSAHAQSLATLIDTNFWSTRTIVEDGHQFWRTYFRYDGKHDVVPIYVPIYQDAVLEETYPKTLKAQFIQLRRWAWGASDVAYVLEKGFFTKNRVPKRDLFFKVLRLLESHISWATAPLILAAAGWLPILLNPEGRESIIAHQLPVLASYINTFIAIGIVITMFLAMKSLPPRPSRYKAHKNIAMTLQWALLPLTSIIYGSFAALYSQTRLLLGRYLDKFDVTTKAVKR